MIAENIEIQMIPLKDLFLSEHNVRTVKASKEEDKILRASIAASGVKQNLVVHKKGKQFGVIAGGRRFEQLEFLHRAKVVKGNYLVPCMIVAEAEVTTISLAENVARAAMHPADEFMAYNKLIHEEGKTLVEVAHQFGTTQRKVKQRMKLACLSPVIIEHFRRGRLTLDQVIAFTLSDDHEKQVAVYKELSPNHLSEHRIKNMLLDSKVTTDHPWVHLVSIKAYKKAGGTLTDDLFNNETYVNDVELLVELATDILNNVAEKMMKGGWKWADISLNRHSYDDFQTRLTADLKDVPKDITESLSKLEEEREKLQLIDFEDWTDKHDERENEIDEAIDKLEERREQYRDFTDEQKAVSGVLVTHNDDEIVFEFGLVKKADMALAFPANKATKKTGEPQNDINDETVESAVLLTDLANFKLQALQSELMKDDKLTYDLMVFSIVKRVFSEHCWSGLPLDVQVTTSDLSKTSGIDETSAHAAIKDFKSGLSIEWLSVEDDGQQFLQFRVLSNAQKKRLLSFCTALAYSPNRVEGIGAQVAEAINFDLSQHWKPTKVNYFERIKKDALLRIGNKMIDKHWQENHAKKSKGEVVDLIEADEAMNDWMPECML